MSAPQFPSLAADVARLQVLHPSFYMVAQREEAIPPDAERTFAERMGARTVEAAAGHLAMVSHPGFCCRRLQRAAQEFKLALAS